MPVADYIIIGAGSAGCVLAERLSAAPENRVLVLEAGGTDTSPWVSLPLGYGILFNDARKMDRFAVEADAGLDNRPALWPRGRIVGGSGSVNAMVYCRGLPNDYDDWETAGATGWGWTAVRETFARLETKVRPDRSSNGDGPIHVQDVSDQIHPVNRHFFAAADELGLPRTTDMNGEDPEGAGIYALNTRKGQRCSSARAFLKPALGRSNLVLRTGVKVRRILIENQRATGIELESGKVLSAAREVILSAGAIASPLLLQRSGIGPGKKLSALGIPVVMNNAHVGGNLQDHIAVSYTFRATEPTLNAILRPLSGKVCAALQYALNRKGPLALSVNQCGGFVRSSNDLPAPDQQLYFNPLSYQMKTVGTRTKFTLNPFDGFIICAQPARPTSRGRVDLGESLTAAPVIQANSLATEEDRQTVIAGGKLCQRLISTKALRGLVAEPLAPDLYGLDDDGLLADFRARASTVFHPVSTCRMGHNAETSVLDCRLKVHGIDGLRVVDASAFPNITSGNTNAPTMMLALKGADLILEDQKQATA